MLPEERRIGGEGMALALFQNNWLAGYPAVWRRLYRSNTCGVDVNRSFRACELPNARLRYVFKEFKSLYLDLLCWFGVCLQGLSEI